MFPSKTRAKKRDTCTGGKRSKVCVPLLLCTNVDGSHQRLPFVIRKSKEPRCLRSYMPMHYRPNAEPWMTSDLFAEWLSEFDRDMHRQGMRVLLVIDNCSALNVQTSRIAVTLLFLPPNTTSKVQPNNSGVEMVKAVWSEVTAICVRNCSRKAGFINTQPEADPDAANGQCGGELWQRVMDSDIGADEDADTAEPCTDEGIVNEVRGKSDAEQSDADDSETSKSLPKARRL
ncbi:hypothetical protein HPB48_016361 [Haemaphysalis longicornis]|uniref:DDE-1 domain-containing protein n=1 Tax=Haemaphysalis longicornis TaxID=44386 RepID=A0A9J6FNL8_HAELO|nr:hypothetical protein HPB48_016361 [Haemaphysalis longicornis]